MLVIATFDIISVLNRYANKEKIMKENKIKILLDTDVGDDIDDALAIALGLSSEEVEFVGITTVFKNTNDRARIAKQLVKNNPYKIPV